MCDRKPKNKELYLYCILAIESSFKRSENSCESSNQMAEGLNKGKKPKFSYYLIEAVHLGLLKSFSLFEKTRFRY